MPISARRVFGFLVLGLGTLVGPLDSSVNIAFPFITGAFGVPLADIRWVIVSYVLTYCSLMLVFGKLGDLFGHKRIFTAGLVVSLVSFLLCAGATEFEWLLAFRVMQGVGAALVLSCGPAIATSLFPESQRSRAVGIYLMMFSVGGVLGPTIGGILVAVWDWPSVFWFRAPISLFALLLVFILPNPPRNPTTVGFDTMGAVLLAVALSAFLLTITQLQHAAQNLLLLIGPCVLAAGSAWLYVRRATSHPSPIIRPGVFRNIDFTVLNLANIFVNLTWFAIMLLVPYYLSVLSGLSVGIGGFVLAISAATTMVVSPIGGWLIGRFAANRMAFVGIVVVVFGSFAIGHWGDTPGVFGMGWPLLLSGFGVGLFQVAYMSIVTGGLPASERGVSGSLALLTRTIGVVGSASFLTWIHASLAAKHRATGASEAEAFQSAFQSTFAAAGALLLVFLAISLLQPGIWFGRTTERGET